MRTLTGTWHNQHGSQIDLELDAEGRVHGKMTVGDGLARSKTFPLVGFVRGDLIGFTVDFGRHGSVTSWTGHVYDEGSGPPRIEALWHMATLVPHPSKADERWKSVWTGADQFSPGPPPREQVRQPPPSMVFWE